MPPKPWRRAIPAFSLERKTKNIDEFVLIFVVCAIFVFTKSKKGSLDIGE